MVFVILNANIVINIDIAKNMPLIMQKALRQTAEELKNNDYNNKEIKHQTTAAKNIPNTSATISPQLQ